MREKLIGYNAGPYGVAVSYKLLVEFVQVLKLFSPSSPQFLRGPATIICSYCHNVITTGLLSPKNHLFLSLQTADRGAIYRWTRGAQNVITVEKGGSVSPYAVSFWLDTQDHLLDKGLLLPLFRRKWVHSGRGGAMEWVKYSFMGERRAKKPACMRLEDAKYHLKTAALALCFS